MYLNLILFPTATLRPFILMPLDMRKILRLIFFCCMLLLFSGVAYGQEIIPNPNETLLWLLMSVIIGISIVCIVLSFTILALIAKVQEKTARDLANASPSYLEQPDFWQRLMGKLTQAIPVAREKEIDMGHSYDGIRELDNKLPPWWLYGFYFSIVISVFYLYYYHVANDWSSEQEYQAEMAEGEKIREAYLAKVANLVNEESVTPLSEANDLKAGQNIYSKNCVACHGNFGEGGIGPNLTDRYWLHGGGIKNIFKTVKYGVVERGMTPWKDVLKPQEIQQVSSFIISLEGSNPQNAKEPQGNPWSPETEVQATDSIAVISMNP